MNHPRGAAAQAFTALNAVIFSRSSQPPTRLLAWVADLAARNIPGADEVSVTVIQRDRPRTAASSGRMALALDERQYWDGAGPCLDAATSSATISITDTGRCHRYPGFALQAHRTGVRRVLSVGMPAHPSLAGALNVYGIRGGRFEPATLDIATRFAGYADLVLSSRRRDDGQAPWGQPGRHGGGMDTRRRSQPR